MKEEKPQTILQRENSKRELLRKLVANARNIISCEVGVSFGVWRMNRLIYWLKQAHVHLSCSREALRRYDADLNQINLHYHDRIIDACFEIIEFDKPVD